jgi:hypothetical protein
LLSSLDALLPPDGDAQPGEPTTVSEALLAKPSGPVSRAARHFRRGIVSKAMYLKQGERLTERMEQQARVAATRGEPVHGVGERWDVGGCGTAIPPSLADPHNRAPIAGSGTIGAVLIWAARQASFGNISDKEHYAPGCGRVCVCCDAALRRPLPQHLLLDCPGPDGLFDTWREERGLGPDLLYLVAGSGGGGADAAPALGPAKAYSPHQLWTLLGESIDSKGQRDPALDSSLVQMARAIHSVYIRRCQDAADADADDDDDDDDDAGGHAPGAGPRRVRSTHRTDDSGRLAEVRARLGEL